LQIRERIAMFHDASGRSFSLIRRIPAAIIFSDRRIFSAALNSS